MPDRWWSWAFTAIPAGKKLIDDFKPDDLVGALKRDVVTERGHGASFVLNENRTRTGAHMYINEKNMKI